MQYGHTVLRDFLNFFVSLMLYITGDNIQPITVSHLISKAFYFCNIRWDDRFTIIRPRKYVCYMHFAHKIGIWTRDENPPTIVGIPPFSSFWFNPVFHFYQRKAFKKEFSSFLVKIYNFHLRSTDSCKYSTLWISAWNRNREITALLTKDGLQYVAEYSCKYAGGWRRFVLLSASLTLDR